MPNETEVAQALGELQGKMDVLLSNVETLSNDVKTKNTEHETRLGSLEQWRAKSTGIVAGTIAVCLTLWELGRTLLLGG